MKPRVWREAPGQWRCEVPGFPWVAFAPTWEKALSLGRSLTELASIERTAADAATDHTPDDMLSGDDFIAHWYTPELSRESRWGT